MQRAGAPTEALSRQDPHGGYPALSSTAEASSRFAKAGAPAAHYAQTYVFLGNLYADGGDADKAREAYERGLRWYPDNYQLKQQLAGMKK